MKHIVLVPMSAAYLNDHVRLLQNPRVYRTLRITDEARSLEGQRKWLEKTLATDHVLAILAHDTFIGMDKLHEINLVDKTSGGGMLISDTRYWGMGIATEVRKRHLMYAFNDLGLRWVYGKTVASNIGAQKLMLKLGYVPQGVRPAARLVDGAYEDELLYGVSKEAFLALHRK